MSTQVTATFIDGVLKPDEALPLPNNARVNLTIEPMTKDASRACAWEALKERIKQHPVHGGGRRFTRDELHERR